MVRTIEKDKNLYDAGSQRTVRASHLQAATLSGGEEAVIFDEQIANDKLAWFGHGGENRLTEVVKHIHADLVASGNGSGTAGDSLAGDLVAVITDSKGRDVLARGEIDDLESLAEAAADPRTERPSMPAMSPYAKPARRIQFRIFADDTVDGFELDPDASDARLYYSEN